MYWRPSPALLQPLLHWLRCFGAPTNQRRGRNAPVENPGNTMTTMRSIWRRIPLTLTLALVLYFGAMSAGKPAFSQDSSLSCGETLSKMDEDLTEIATLAEEFANQRDRALRLAEKNRTERDRCEGRLAEVSAVVRALQVTQSDYEKTIAKFEARPRPHVWYLAGFATPIALAGIGFLVWMAVTP